MLIIAHRGASGHFPENTLLSFEEAIKTGAKAIELDIHACKTGELVVIHDDTVNRTTNKKGNIDNFSLLDLNKLNAGKNEKIPSLLEVLNLVNSRAKINIELKGKGTGKKLAAFLTDYCKAHKIKHSNFYISSFRHNELKTFHHLAPDFPIGILYHFYPRHFVMLAKKLKAHSINVSFSALSSTLVNKIHSHNLEVWVYTVNTIEQYDKVERLGVDAVFTNFPKLFVESRKK